GRRGSVVEVGCLNGDDSRFANTDGTDGEAEAKRSGRRPRAITKASIRRRERRACDNASMWSKTSCCAYQTFTWLVTIGLSNRKICQASTSICRQGQILSIFLILSICARIWFARALHGHEEALR